MFVSTFCIFFFLSGEVFFLVLASKHACEPIER